MFDLRAKRLRVVLAAFCVALMTLLTGQVAMAAADQVHHALGIDHAANPLAGEVAFDGDHHGAGQDHHSPPAPAPDDDGDDDNAPGPAHHHSGDGPQTPALLAGIDANLPELGRSATLPIKTTAVRPTPRIFGLERPPRSPFENFA